MLPVLVLFTLYFVRRRFLSYWFYCMAKSLKFWNQFSIAWTFTYGVFNLLTSQNPVIETFEAFQGLRFPCIMFIWYEWKQPNNKNNNGLIFLGKKFLSTLSLWESWAIIWTSLNNFKPMLLTRSLKYHCLETASKNSNEDGAFMKPVYTKK